MSSDEGQLNAIRQIAEPILTSHTAELVELTCHRHAGQWLIRLLVDKVGGVTIGQCARLNQEIGQALETAGTLQESYTLEVSSPGLDRPLISKRDFERALGEQVELELLAPIGASRHVSGQLLSVQQEAVVISTSSGNVTVPLNQIRVAKKTITI